MIFLILASGRGSRLQKHTKKKPKCLVEVNEKPILKYLQSSFRFFKKIIIVTGYRSNMIEKFLKNQTIVVNNKDYKTTNMTHSLFCASNLVDDDVIISYSDIIYDSLILKRLIKCKKTTLPLNYDWLSTWALRMPKNEIINDAEDVKVKNKKVISIAGKISPNKLPKMQFMGIIKISKLDFFKLRKFYKDIQNREIDFTNFLNLAIKNKIIRVNYMRSHLFWTEIDTQDDLKVAEKIAKDFF